MMFLEGPKATITALAFSPDGNHLAVGCRDGSLSLANIFDGTFQTLVTDPPSINAIVFNESGTNLLAGGPSGWFRFQRDDAEKWDVFVAPRTPATTALAFLNENVLVVGSGNPIKAEAGQLELWNLLTGKRKEPFFREPSGVRAVAVHADTHLVAWSNGSNRLGLWNTLSLEPRYVSLKHASPSLAFHPDGETLALALDYGVTVFDVPSRLERLTLKGHAGRVTSLAYRPDGHTIATASWDKTVRLWDARSGTTRATFDWGVGKVNALAFAPDGLRLAAGGENGMIALWDVE